MRHLATAFEDERQHRTRHQARPPSLSKQAEDLPNFLKGKHYTEESALLEDLEENGVRDLHIVLSKDGYAAWREMPSDAHNDVVSMINGRFTTWKMEQAPRLNGCAVEQAAEPNVLITRSFSPKKRGSGECHPDFSIFGRDRLDEYFTPRLGDDEHNMNPHVIVRFGWGNKDWYEEHAIDDMMNHSGVGRYARLGRPNVAILIKAQWKGDIGNSPVIGFNTYTLRRDDRRKNVEPDLYRVGGVGDGGEDSLSSITAADMGLSAPAEGVEPFTIDVHAIRKLLQRKNRAPFEAPQEGTP